MNDDKGEMPINEQLRSQIESLRKLGYLGSEICDKLQIHRSLERKAVTDYLATPKLRRYQAGIQGVASRSPHRIRSGNWA